MAYNPRDNSNTEVSSKESTRTLGIVAVVAIIVLAFAGYFFHTTRDKSASQATSDIMAKPSAAASAAYDSTKDAASSAYESAKDGAVEIPQAAKDAVTKGDQNTTRPNSDGSTGKLDQKPAK